MTRDQVLAAVAGHVDYLRAATDAPAADGWVSCEDLCRGGPALVAALEASTAEVGGGDPLIGASLFVQGAAFRVGGVALAALALGLPVPSVAPSSTALRLAGPWPSGVAHLVDEVASPDPARVAAELLDGHLARLVDAVRAHVRVGHRLLWGDVAASCAVAFRAVESSGADRAAVRAAAAAFLAAPAATDHLDGSGRFEVVRGPAREGWFWTRTSCCLWYRVADGGRLCDDCSLWPADELAARRRAELSRPRS